MSALFPKGFASLRLQVVKILLGTTYTLLSYRGAGLTIGGDNIVPLHSFAYLTRLSSPIDLWAGFGSQLPPVFSLPTVPDTFLFLLFSPFDIYVANKLYLLFLVTLSIFSICYLATAVFSESVHKDLIGIVAACAYIFNPWVIADTFKTMIFIELSLAQTGFILFLAFTVKYLQTKQVRYLLYSGLSTLLMLSSPGLSAYRLTFFASLAYVFMAVYFLANVPRSEIGAAVFGVLKGGATVAIISFVLNSYWIIPFVQNVGHFSSFAAGFQAPTLFNRYSVMVNTLRLMNSWSFYSGYVPYAESFLKNPAVVLLTFTWPVCAFAPLLSKRVVKNRKILAIYLVTVLTILLACGTQYPLGGAYMVIVDLHLGSYYFLRPFYNTGALSQLVLTVEYALLIGLFSSAVYSWLTRRSEGFRLSRRKLVATSGTIMIVILLALSSWPILTGDVMRNWYSPNQYGVRIPECYWEANEYIEEICSLNQRVLLLPSTQTYLGTSWGYQGTSQFYNLMFNVPLITGNEVPYSITANKTLTNRIYSVYYKFPNANDAVDVINRTHNIIAWQNDSALLDEGLLQLDFNKTYEINKWHQVELRLPLPEAWSTFTHIVFQFSGELGLDKLQIGIGDTSGYVGWWTAEKHVYQVENETLIPTETEPLITQYNATVTILLPLEEPDRSSYSINNVTSVWVQYFVTETSDATLQIDKILVGRVLIDDLYYADFLNGNNVKYLIVDLAVQDGAKTDPRFWLNLLTDSDYFRLIWKKESLCIFENTVF